MQTYAVFRPKGRSDGGREERPAPASPL